MDEGWAITYSTDDDSSPASEIMRLEGGEWAIVARYEDRMLWDLELVGKDEVWIAGMANVPSVQPVLMHRRAGEFEDVPVSGCGGLLGLQMLDADRGWAVGFEESTCVLRFENGRWIREPSPGSDILMAVDLDETGTGWAIGSEGLILRREKDAWKEVASPTTAGAGSLYYDLQRVGAEEAWAVGLGESPCLHYTDGIWGTEDLGMPASLRGIDTTSDGRIWVVGSRPAPDMGLIQGPEPLMLVRDGDEWAEVPLPTLPIGLRAIAMVDAQSGWALGPGIAVRLGAPGPTATASPSKSPEPTGAAASPTPTATTASPPNPVGRAYIPFLRANH